MTRLTTHLRRQAIAYTALFVALGGTAWAVATVGPNDIRNDAVRARHIAPDSVFSGQIANETIRSWDLRDDDVRGRDVHDGTIGGADVANGSLTGDEITNAPSGNDDVNAERLGGKRARAFASAESEPYHEVGAPGEPTFQNEWVNSVQPCCSSNAGFYLDSEQLVHLKGTITNPGTAGGTAFTLPPGYRPSINLNLPMSVRDPADLPWLRIESTGNVQPRCIHCTVGIDGLTFRINSGFG